MNELEALSLPELLARAGEPALPPPVPWWPAAPGWAIVAGIAATLALGLAWRHWRRHQRAGYRRAALAELERITMPPDPPVPAGVPIAIATIVRRAALAAYPRREVAALHGEAWLQYLNSRCPRPVFSPQQARLLARDAFSTHPAIAPEQARALLRAASAWLRLHHA